MLTYIENLFRNIAEKRGLQNHNLKIDISSGNRSDKGFRGDIYTVSMVDVNGRKLNSIVKCGSTDEAIVSEYHIKEVFENELNFYEDICPTITKFQEEKNSRYPFKSLAEFYGSHFDGNVRLIALENLRTRGFVLFDKKSTVDDYHVEEVFKEYGKLHGAFFVYRNEHKGNFERVTGKLRNCWKMYMEEKAFTTLLTATCKEVSNILLEEDVVLANKFRIFADAERVFRDICIYKGRFDTLTHGDSWSNNFMFKYKKNEKVMQQIEEIKIIDWQNIGIGTPVYDLSYFLYSNASGSVFANLDHHLEVYYDSLSTTVKDLGGRSEVLYPLDALKADWKEYSIFGFMMGLMLQRLKLMENEQIVDIDDFKADHDGEKLSSELCDSKFDTATFKERAIDLVLHMSQIGVL